MGRTLTVLAVAIAGLTLVAATKVKTKTVTKTKISGAAARGKYLVTMAGCGDCHTPQKFDAQLGMPVPDLSRAFSGHPEGAPDPEGTLGPHDQALIGPTFTEFKLQFGTVYSANLTPDRETGLGGWTADQFIKTMRTGHQLGTGREILPPMPWPDFARMTDQDLRAMFAFLQSVKPIHNAVPAPKVPPEVIQHIGETMDKVVGTGAGK